MANWGNYVYSPTGSGGYWCTGIQVTKLWETASAIAYQVDCIVYCHYGWDVNAHGSCSANVTSGVNDGTTSASWSGSIYSPSGQDTQVTKCSFSVQYAKYYGQTRPVTFSASNTVTGGFGNGTSTASWSVTIAARSDYNAPAAPTGCSAARASDARVNVSWANGSSTSAAPRSQVRVERSVDGGSWAQVASLGASATSYADTSVSSNHRYQYRVRSYGSGGYSTYSTSGYVYTTPSSPTGCSASRSSDSSVTVRWSRGSNAGATYTGQRVERSVDGGSWAQVATPAATATSWTDTSTSANHRYQYRVRAYNGLYSGYATSGYVYTTPSAPSGCSAARASDSQASVSWSLGSNAAASWQGVTVERSVDGGGWSQVANLTGTPTSWTDSSVSANHRYQYRVRSRNAQATSSYATSGYVYTTPVAPSSLSTSTSGTTVTVSVSGLGRWAQTWDLERSVNGGQTWVPVSTDVPASTTSVEDELSGTATWRARCSVAGLDSEWTRSDSVTTIVRPAAPTPTSPASGSVMDSAVPVELSWRHNPLDGSAQERAEVQVSSDGSDWDTEEVVGAAGSLELDLGPYSGGRVYWRVRTKGSHPDFSEWSSTQSLLAYPLPQVALEMDDTLERFPFEIPWSFSDEYGSQASASVTLSVGGEPVLTLRSGDEASVSVLERDVSLSSGAVVSVSLAATSTTGLSGSAEGSFSVDYQQPVAPSVSVSVDRGSLLVNVSVEPAPGDEGHLETASVDVYRGATPLALGLAQGGVVTDYVPPLDTPLEYVAVARSSVGSSAQATATSAVRSRGALAVNFGTGLASVAVLPFDVEISERELSEREEFEAASYDVPVVAYGSHRTREGEARGSCDGALRPRSSEDSWRSALRASGEHVVRLPGGALFAAAVEGELSRSGELTGPAFSLSVSWKEAARDGLL